MAEIYLARVPGAPSTQPQLVVKRMLPDLVEDPLYVEMFLSEARITAQLVHPNIVSVIDICDEPGNYFYSMEYVRGSDLLELMRVLAAQHRAVPVECAVTIAIGVCAALEHTHTLTDSRDRPLDVIHRDVSLANILLGYDGSVKLADFGVMRHGGRAPTEPGILKGKLGYMSPEQVLGAPLDHRSDLFALGVVLYEITTGERLFPPCDRDEESLAQVARCAITPPSELMFDYPVDLGAIVMTALARKPQDRYACARDMQRDLQTWLRVHGKTEASRSLGELVTRMFPISPTRPRPNDTAELDALVGSLVPVSPADSAQTPLPPRRAEPPRRSRVPALVAVGCAFTVLVLSAWAAWTEVTEQRRTVSAVTLPEPPAPDPTEIQGAAAAAIGGLAVRGAVPATVARPDAERVIAALRECHRSPPLDDGTDVEVAFELVDTRISTRVGPEGLDQLPSCAQRAASLLDGRAVVVTITFKPS